MRAAGQGVVSVGLKHCDHPSPVVSSSHISSDRPVRWPPKITILGPEAVVMTADAWKEAPELIDCSLVSLSFANGFRSSSPIVSHETLTRQKYSAPGSPCNERAPSWRPAWLIEDRWSNQFENKVLVVLVVIVFGLTPAIPRG